MMKLFDDLDNTLVDPTPSQIRDFILNLTRGDAFAIFEMDDQFYMQSSGTVDTGFILEYREGSEDKHFGVYNPSLTADEVITAFCEYAESKEGYKLRYSWDETF
jgi:hypothetical protein